MTANSLRGHQAKITEKRALHNAEFFSLAHKTDCIAMNGNNCMITRPSLTRTANGKLKLGPLSAEHERCFCSKDLSSTISRDGIQFASSVIVGRVDLKHERVIHFHRGESSLTSRVVSFTGSIFLLDPALMDMKVVQNDAGSHVDIQTGGTTAVLRNSTKCVARF